MMKSMTAFGRAVAEGEERNVTVELKSVNSRFFDASVKLPRAYNYFEIFGNLFERKQQKFL